MINTRIAHAFPDLSEGQALLARLSEIFEMARDLKMTQGEIDGADAQRAKELIASAGSPEELSVAEKTAHATVLGILARISEDDLKAGLEAGLLLPEDYQDALKAMRAMGLEQRHSTEREEEREV